MAINFDSLPKDKPTNFPVVPDGYYRFTVKTAEMRTSKSGSEYLTVQLNCTALKSNSQVTVFDNFFDTDKPLVRYKLQRFLRSINLNLTGSFTLKDLTKVIVNKSGVTALKTEQNEGYSPRNVVDAFDDGIYYNIGELEEDQGPDQTVIDGYTFTDEDAPIEEIGAEDY